MDLVPISSKIADAVIDLRYATSNNFTYKTLYDINFIAKLNVDALVALEKAAESFRSMGLIIVIWDAYRPERVQKYFKKLIKDRRYVKEESLHLRGLAVDLTLAKLNGEYLDMGTDFDNFSEMAHIECGGLSIKQKNHRMLLAKVMAEAGFKTWPYEWWHFDYEPLVK